MRGPGSGRLSGGRRLSQAAQLVEPLHRRLGDPGGGRQGAHTTHAGCPVLKHTLLGLRWAPVRIRPALLGRLGADPTAILAALTAPLDRPTTLGTRAAPAAHLLIVIVPTGQRAEARGLRFGQADTRAEALLAVLTRALLIRRLGLPTRGTRPSPIATGKREREMTGMEALAYSTPLARHIPRLAMGAPPSPPTRRATTPGLAVLYLLGSQIDQRAADRARALLATSRRGAGKPLAGATGAFRTMLLLKPRWGPVANLTTTFLAPQHLTLAGTGAATRKVAPRLPTLRVMLMPASLALLDRDRDPREQALLTPAARDIYPPLGHPCLCRCRDHLRQLRGQPARGRAKLLFSCQHRQLERPVALRTVPSSGCLMALVAAEHGGVARPCELRVTLRTDCQHSTPSRLYHNRIVPRRIIAGLVW